MKFVNYLKFNNELDRLCYLICFLCILFITLQANAQHPDLIKFKEAKQLSNKQTEFNICRGIAYQAEDTSLNRTEQFHAAYRNYIAFQDFGFQLSPTRNLNFDVYRQIGFNFFENPYAIYFKQANQTYSSLIHYAPSYPAHQ